MSSGIRAHRPHKDEDPTFWLSGPEPWSLRDPVGRSHVSLAECRHHLSNFHTPGFWSLLFVNSLSGICFCWRNSNFHVHESRDLEIVPHESGFVIELVSTATPLLIPERSIPSILAVLRLHGPYLQWLLPKGCSDVGSLDPLGMILASFSDVPMTRHGITRTDQPRALIQGSRGLGSVQASSWGRDMRIYTGAAGDCQY